MATSRKAASEVRADSGADDLNVLHPERTAEISGRQVTMREYGFVEGLKLGLHVDRVVSALAEVAGQGEALTAAALRRVFASCPDDVQALISAACDQPVEWVAGLADRPGQDLMLLWWVTNADFFVRRVVETVAMARLSRASAGAMSTTPSSQPATTSTGSAVTPAGN